MIDVRAPVEFEQGAFPSSINLPIMNDAERHNIGICYKARGQHAAIELGHKLVSGAIRERRVAAWQNVLRTDPNAVLYCSRGGKRSSIAGEWLKAAGTPVEVIPGGYKRMRQSLLGVLDTLPSQTNVRVIAGQTGSGKTLLLAALNAANIDLEGLANHRGSAFGRYPSGQPSQVAFDNNVAVELLQRQLANDRVLFVEDESQRVGRLKVPPALFAQMSTAPLLLLEEPLDARVERIHAEYVSAQLACYQVLRGRAHGFAAYSTYLQTSLDAIAKRLGGVRHQHLCKVVQQALALHARGDDSAHRQWIRVLLTDYYDPMYQYQLSQKLARVVFRGSFDAVRDYANQQDVA